MRELILTATLVMLSACNEQDEEARKACSDEAAASAKQNEITENCIHTANCGVEVRELYRYYKSKEILAACEEKHE